jgi:hypothetical protein
MLDRRFETNLPSFRGSLRPSAANQSLVSFHSFRFCNKVSRAAIRSSGVSHLKIRSPQMPEEDNGYASRTNR